MPTLEELEKKDLGFGVGQTVALPAEPQYEDPSPMSVQDEDYVLFAKNSLSGQAFSRQRRLQQASYGELLDAAVREDNSAYNAALLVSNMEFKNSEQNIPNEGFNREAYLQTLGVLEQDYDLYDGYNSKIGIDRMRQQILDRDYASEVRAANPLRGFSMTAVSQIGEPLNYFILGRGASLTAKAGKTGAAAAQGASKVSRAAMVSQKIKKATEALRLGDKGTDSVRLAAEAMMAETGIEMVLQAAQPERTIAESAMAITAATGFGAFVGYGSRDFARLVGNMDEKMTEAMIDITSTVEDSEVVSASLSDIMAAVADPDSSVGAQMRAVDGSKLGPRDVANKAFLAIGKNSAMITPGMRGLFSKTPEVRGLFADISNIGQNRQISEADQLGQFGASPTSASTKSSMLSASTMGSFGRITREAFKEEYKALKGSLKKREIMELAAKALRRADENVDDLTHPRLSRPLTPEEKKIVHRIARGARKEVLDPFKERALKSGLTEEMVMKYSENYFPRMYNIQKIIQNPTGWAKALRGAASREFDNLADQLPKELKAVEAKLRGVADDANLEKARLEEELEKLQNGVRYFSDRRNLDEFQVDYADRAAQHITTSQNPLYDTFEVSTRGPIKERTLAAHDFEVEEFLNDDLEEVMGYFSRTMSGEIAMKETFGTTRFGDYIDEVIRPAQRKTRDRIENEFNAKIKAADSESAKAKLEDKRKKSLDELSTEQKREINDAEAAWDMIRGVRNLSQFDPDGIFRRTSLAARLTAMMALLPNFVVSSLVDIAMPSMVHGISGTIGKGPFARAVRQVSSPEVKARLKASKVDLNDAGLALNRITNERIASLALVDDNVVGNRTVLEKMIYNMSNKFGTLTGGNFWNDTMQETVAHMSSARLSRITRTPLGKIPQKDRDWLSRNGMSSSDLAETAEQWKKYGLYDDDVPVFGFRDWDNQELAEKVKGLMFNDNRAIILHRGDLEINKHADTDIGRLLAQFQTHTMVAHNRVFLSSLERVDKESIMGLTNMAMMGSLVYYLKELQAGREPSDDWRVWLIKGVDNSGILTVGMALNNSILEKSSMLPGLSDLTEDEDFQRLQKMGGFDARMGGPVSGYTEMLFKGLHGVGEVITQGETSDSNISAGIRAIPYLSLPYLKTWTNNITEHLQEEYGRD